jgi:hypothetical protein
MEANACRSCGETMPEGADNCPSCGHERHCSGCGACQHCPRCGDDAHEGECRAEGDGDDDGGPSWADRHSVGCYFCGRAFDERDGSPADDLNGGDGGDCCPECRRRIEASIEAAAERLASEAEGQETPDDFDLKPAGGAK